MRKSERFSSRGSGRFDTSNTPQKKMRGSMRIRKQRNFDPNQFIVAECSIQDVQIYKQVFDFLDDDHDGMLTPMDLRKCIRNFGGYNPDKYFIYIAMSVFDADDGGEISFKQFVKLMTQKPYQSDTNEDIDRIFTYFDEDNKGYISEQDLMRTAEQLKVEINYEDIKQMIRKCDTDGTGVIRPKAFLAFNKRKTFE